MGKPKVKWTTKTPTQPGYYWIFVPNTVTDGVDTAWLPDEDDLQLFIDNNTEITHWAMCEYPHAPFINMPKPGYYWIEDRHESKYVLLLKEEGGFYNDYNDNVGHWTTFKIGNKVSEPSFDNNIDSICEKIKEDNIPENILDESTNLATKEIYEL